MTLLNLCSRNLIKLEIEGEVLLAYPKNSKPKKFSLKNVTSLNCSDNKLTSLPPLPEGLTDLDCSGNKLTSLPLLPKRLTDLDCSNNLLLGLPLLPRKLEVLDCSGNHLSELPLLPKGLEELNCSNNHLSELSSLPEGLEELDCYANPLKYIPFLKNEPGFLIVPTFLEEKYTTENYQEGYRLQEINRYLFLSFFVEVGVQLDFLG